MNGGEGLIYPDLSSMSVDLVLPGCINVVQCEWLEGGGILLLSENRSDSGDI